MSQQSYASTLWRNLGNFTAFAVLTAAVIAVVVFGLNF